MPEMHEPDPRFIRQLEGRLTSELRERRELGRRRDSARLPWVIFGSALFGAFVTGAAFQTDSGWRMQLVEERLETRLEIAEERREIRERALADAHDKVRAGTFRQAVVAELSIDALRARADAELIRSRLDEVRASNRVPDDAITAPLIDGRDFVTERLELRRNHAQGQRIVAARAHATTTRRWEVGAATQVDVDMAALAEQEARWEWLVAGMRTVLRRQYLNDQMDATTAELTDLRIEAQYRVRFLASRQSALQRDAERTEDRFRQGLVPERTALEARQREAEVEAELELARRELGIIQEALEDHRAR